VTAHIQVRIRSDVRLLAGADTGHPALMRIRRLRVEFVRGTRHGGHRRQWVVVGRNVQSTVSYLRRRAAKEIKTRTLE